jgi:predicted extracellular nuclease
MHAWVLVQGGDGALYGGIQPPILTSETQRVAQANLVAAFVREVLAIDASANVVVAGDLNDFQWSPPLMVRR